MKIDARNNRSSVPLTGLDGSNPLAFLAAIGVSKVLSQNSSISLGWATIDGIWRPLLFGRDDKETVIKKLESLLRTEMLAPWNLSKKLPFDAELFRTKMIASIQDSKFFDRTTIDVFAAFGSEVFRDEKGQFQDTAFRMVRSATPQDRDCPITHASWLNNVNCRISKALYLVRGRSRVHYPHFAGIPPRIASTRCKQSTRAKMVRQPRLESIALHLKH